jgi:membrane protein
VKDEVEQLVEYGLLGLMAKPDGVALIKPPELISIKEVLDATRDGRGGDMPVAVDTSDPVHGVLRRRDEAVEVALAGQTLRSLVVEEGEPTLESSPSDRREASVHR